MLTGQHCMTVFSPQSRGKYSRIIRRIPVPARRGAGPKQRSPSAGNNVYIAQIPAELAGRIPRQIQRIRLRHAERKKYGAGTGSLETGKARHSPTREQKVVPLSENTKSSAQANGRNRPLVGGITLGAAVADENTSLRRPASRPRGFGRDRAYGRSCFGVMPSVRLKCRVR
jgi:hypothetical protein